MTINNVKAHDVLVSGLNKMTAKNGVVSLSAHLGESSKGKVSLTVPFRAAFSFFKGEIRQFALDGRLMTDFEYFALVNKAENLETLISTNRYTKNDETGEYDKSRLTPKMKQEKGNQMSRRIINQYSKVLGWDKTEMASVNFSHKQLLSILKASASAIARCTTKYVAPKTAETAKPKVIAKAPAKARKATQPQASVNA